MLADKFDCHDADFIAVVASVSEAAELEYAKRRKLFVDEFDKRVESLVDNLHARLNALAVDICLDFDLVVSEYRSHLKPLK